MVDGLNTAGRLDRAIECRRSVAVTIEAMRLTPAGSGDWALLTETRLQAGASAACRAGRSRRPGAPARVTGDGGGAVDDAGSDGGAEWWQIEAVAAQASERFGALTSDVHLRSPAVALYMRTGFRVAGPGRGRHGAAMLRSVRQEDAGTGPASTEPA